MLNICIKSKKTSSFTARINAFRVIERLERMDILCGQNTQSINNDTLSSYSPPRADSKAFPLSFNWLTKWTNSAWFLKEFSQLNRAPQLANEHRYGRSLVWERRCSSSFFLLRCERPFFGHLSLNDKRKIKFNF